MSRIVLCTSSGDLLEHLRTPLAAQDERFQLVATSQVPSAADPAALWRDAVEGPPQVVVLDCATAGTGAALELAARLDELCPALSVVLISDAGSEVALAAIRAGATDILHPAADAAEVVQVIQRAAELADVRTAQQLGAPPAEALPSAGRVISVVSPKGGVGKTTVATNLAVGLARTAPQATVLVDLDIQFGDVASGLNLDPEYFLPSAVSGAASRDTMVLKTFLTLHETGLYVLAAPESPIEADGISADDVRRLLRTLAGEFRYVVVDTAPGLSEHTLAVLDETSDLVLLSSMDVPGLRGLRKELETLRTLDLLGQRRQLVVNFADPATGLSAADVEATIGAPVDVLLPRSKAAPTSVNLGVPLLQSGTRDPMTKQLRALVDRLSDGAAGGRAPKPLPGFKPKASGGPAPRRAASGWFRRPRAVAS
ncbi:MAG: Type II/IV secretion system ATPase TadZ/CpaE, associated with Flp pilus assembly [uncultured Friedmanniella sp.]|uniref:Type II/IV secretion system ATPase TadZ/CpaE, associated with Flp pilus assembly n=1 Tax=uncultured Friedmanniella sp. TaxID=335381 RepID=A0A6J4KMN1_9ACTN|nr:AAA family ATPase [uncultured Friedmanniella sp.]CAA9308696.1 MAG: Type II/IV secretion system ATPase TadZ/CpaE, associated with Flp pilus assembly [uncultured Friedmanniella sp.]